MQNLAKTVSLFVFASILLSMVSASAFAQSQGTLAIQNAHALGQIEVQLLGGDNIFGVLNGGTSPLAEFSRSLESKLGVRLVLITDGTLNILKSWSGGVYRNTDNTIFLKVLDHEVRDLVEMLDSEIKARLLHEELHAYMTNEYDSKSIVTVFSAYLTQIDPHEFALELNHYLAGHNFQELMAYPFEINILTNALPSKETEASNSLRVKLEGHTFQLRQLTSSALKGLRSIKQDLESLISAKESQSPNLTIGHLTEEIISSQIHKVEFRNENWELSLLLEQPPTSSKATQKELISYVSRIDDMIVVIERISQANSQLMKALEVNTAVNELKQLSSDLYSTAKMGIPAKLNKYEFALEIK